MTPSIALKDKVREDAVVRGRLLAAVAGILVLLVLLVWRLTDLQVVSHQHFITQSENNRVKIVPEPPIRGLIYDRNGVLLAQNTPSYTLELVPEAVSDLDATLDALGDVVEISAQDVERFRQLASRKRSFESIPLKFRLSDEEVARFAVNRHRFPGTDIQARLTRHYPLGEVTAHVVGYVGRLDEAALQRVDPVQYSGTSHVGKTGVERSYEKVLHGIVGYLHVENNAQGRRLRVLERVSPSPGSDLFLHLDAALQREALAALGDHTGAVVAIDPNNGGLLALASKPGYDPNLFVNGIDTESYADLSGSPLRPLFNRAIRGQYPPGSTIKPMMGLAGLEYGVELATGHTFCRGWYQLPNSSHRYRDWKRTGHGKVDLNWAILRSCDVYFYEMAHALGIDRMHEFMTRFGFGVRTGVDIAGEAAGLMPSKDWKRAARHKPWYRGETLITGIGQGFMLATPLQLAQATAIVANRGRILRPRLVQSFGDPDQEGVLEPAPAPGSLGLRDAAFWRPIVSAMEDTVHTPRGTAHRIADGLSYRMAGKTGTAQVFGLAQDEEYDAESLKRELRDHGLFIAFAPVDQPRIAVAVVVEHGGGGSTSAAPIARRVIDHYLARELPAAMDMAGEPAS
ncbi:MAG: penicillin-binding protein 2 [Gammaproteobacteria bacterium]|nr:penicillin-binding protein 2 [Gammaproteobacteria bacterium]